MEGKKVFITAFGWGHTGKIGEIVSTECLGSQVFYLIKFEDGQSREMKRSDFEFI